MPTMLSREALGMKLNWCGALRWGCVWLGGMVK